MKSARIIGVVLVIVITISLINWVRDDANSSWSITLTIPLLGGHKPGIYDVAALALIIFTIMRITRKPSGKKDSIENDWEYEEVEEEEEDKDDEDEDDDSEEE